MCNCNGMADFLNALPSHRVSTPNTVVLGLGLTVYATVGENPQNLGPLGSRRLGVDADRLKTKPSHMCFHPQFGCSSLNSVVIHTGEPQNWGPLGLRTLRTEPPKMPPPHVCYHVKFSSSATNGVRINVREPPKLDSAVARPMG